MVPVLEGKSIGSDPKKKNNAKRRAPELENQRIKLGTKVQPQLKDSICFKSIQIGS
jgi:hypothetical protein